MSRFWATAGALALASSMLQSCGDPITAPKTREIRLSSCRRDILWAGYQNEGSRTWTRIDGLYPGVTISATARLAIAVFYRGGPIVDFLTADQAAATFVCDGGSAAMKTISGSIRGLGANEIGYVTVAPSSVASVYADGPFTTRVGVGPVDLVATRLQPLASGGNRTTAMIVRRGLDPPDGATLPTLDFNSAEAFAPESTGLTMQGVPSGWKTVALVNFIPRGGDENPLFYGLVTGPTTTIPSVPASRLASGDLQLLILNANAPATLVSGIKLYHLGSAQTIAVGPQLNEPVFTTVATTPTFRFRIDMVAQPEYPSAIQFVISQTDSSGPGPRLTLNASKEYFGNTPGIWSLTVPDFSGADGYQSSWGFSSERFDWVAYATSLPYGFSYERNARDGDGFLAAELWGTR